jgi:glycosyltransferase involved in cell wall biosynthesis
VEALVATLIGLLSNPTKLAAMSQAAAEHARQRFSWESTAKTLIALCEGKQCEGKQCEGKEHERKHSEKKR